MNLYYNLYVYINKIYNILICNIKFQLLSASKHDVNSNTSNQNEFIFAYQFS